MLLHVAFDLLINMVCNDGMQSIEKDAQIIRDLGGPSQVAELIGIDKRRGGAQRVQNWLVRGIPYEMKVRYPRYFMPELAQSHANNAQAATDSVATSGQGA